jgi:hypothetical protein
MRAPWLVLLLAVWLAGACSAVPNMDHGSAGCQNARGIGVASDHEPRLLARVADMSALDAGQVLAGLGHTVVFNTGGDCWCVPPPGGRVTDAWFGQHGALWLWVEDVDPSLTAGEPPFQGYGC